MTRRIVISCCLLVLAAIIVACAATTDRKRAPPSEQTPYSGSGGTISKDGCRIRPADDGAGKNVDCSGLQLGHIPGDLPTCMTKLTMRRNNIIRLDGSPFESYSELTTLDLSRNELDTVGAEVFVPLWRLEKLDLTYNKLCMNKSTFPVRLFSRMKSLRRLTMTSNTCKTRHAEYPDEALAMLTNLTYLSLPGIPTSRLGDRFDRLTKLKTLVFAGHGCNMSVLRNKTFNSLRNVSLSQLCIKTCRLKTIEPGAFEPLSQLKTLNLACNREVGFKNVYNAIISAKNMKLNTLVADDVSPIGMVLEAERFVHNAFTDIERMSVRANYITVIDVRILKPLKNMTHINLGYNGIMMILPKIHASEVLFTTMYSLNVDVLDISDVFTDVSVYRKRYCFREAVPSNEDATEPTEYFFRNRPMYDVLDYSRVRPSATASVVDMTEKKELELLTIPPSVQVIYANRIFPKKITAKLNFSQDNDVVVVNISYNAFVAIGPIRGLHRCQVIDLRNCTIKTISPGSFSDLPMLKYLYLMDNQIGKNGFDLKGTFDGLLSLEVLDLSGNSISEIHESAFSSLSSLRVLSLRRNMLTFVNFDISNAPHIATIDLRDNSITGFHSLLCNTADKRHIHVILDRGLCTKPAPTSHKTTTVAVSVLGGLAAMVMFALTVIIVRRQLSCNCLCKARRRVDDDDDEQPLQLGPDTIVDDVEPELSFEQPVSMALGEPNEWQLQAQTPEQCKEE